MAKDISLFSGYEQRENRTTNYCLLVLRMLYEENPKLLAEALAAIAGESVADAVGVHFLQQQRIQDSVPDGLIVQKPFSVFIETKNFDWFHNNQLESHLDGLNDYEPGLKVLLALSNFESTDSTRFRHVSELCATKYSGSIAFASLGFEDFYSALPRNHVSRNLSDLLLDFRSYLDNAGLLPRWRNLLDVVNCAGSSRVVLGGSAYICPPARGAYNHARCQYFGMYKDKRVSHVAHIAAVVELDDIGTTAVKWQNVETAAADLRERARVVHERFDPSLLPAQVFLLDDLTETDFLKSTKGGMLASKRYFDIEHLHAVSAPDLAAKLRGRTWESLASATVDV